MKSFKSDDLALKSPTKAQRVSLSLCLFTSSAITKRFVVKSTVESSDKIKVAVSQIFDRVKSVALRALRDKKKYSFSYLLIPPTSFRYLVIVVFSL
jgi:hypothetical protein